MLVRYAILGTYPPTQCGLATFSRALADSLASPTDVPVMVSVVDEPSAAAGGRVCHEWVRNRPGGSAAAAAALNRADVAIIQHEYGIYPGRDGADVLDVLRALTVPAVTVLHTVLVTPSRQQRVILEEVVERSAAVVTMTHTGKQRLVEHYGVDPAVVHVIPHGAADNRTPGKADGVGATAPVVLTWGLIGPGKGIEWGIAAMAHLRDLSPRPRYLVVGQTHPRVRERSGENYRQMLIGLASDLGVTEMVDFDDRYLTQAQLNGVLQRADVVLCPYDSQEQVTSGVLIEAVSAGKPVVSTGFPHAWELLASGSGLIVERQNPVMMADALRWVLTEPGVADRMAAEAYRIAPELLWPAVAQRYRKLARSVLVGAALPALA